MSSPPRYGSSRTTGGSTRGHAVGNVFNFADAGDSNDTAVENVFNFADAGGDEDTSVSRTGRVHIYNSSVDPNQVKPFRILKIDVQFSMAPLLKSIAAKWSPIESM